MWPENTKMNMHVYFSTSPTGDVDFSGDAGANDGFPSFTWNQITYGDWKLDESKEFDLNIPTVSVLLA
jgi:hypothetical protein